MGVKIDQKSIKKGGQHGKVSWHRFWTDFDRFWEPSWNLVGSQNRSKRKPKSRYFFEPFPNWSTQVGGGGSSLRPPPKDTINGVPWTPGYIYIYIYHRFLFLGAIVLLFWRRCGGVALHKNSGESGWEGPPGKDLFNLYIYIYIYIYRYMKP